MSEKVLKWVLVVEDDVSLRTGLESVLQATGYAVKTAANGREAMNLMREDPLRPWHAVLTDIHMPEMDGMEVLETIRRESMPISRLIVLSGEAREPGYQAQIAHWGAVGLPKPFHPSELLQILERVPE